MVLEHRSLGEQVADLLRERIVRGELEPGTRLVERTLAEGLGVSRVPVRDAINQLKGEGFVTHVQRTGAIVTEVSRRRIEELFEVRGALEVLSVRQAAKRATAEQIARLEDLVDQAGRAMAAADEGAFNETNEQLHDGLVAAADNALLVSTIQPITGQLHWLLRQHGESEVLHEEHAAMVHAIAAHDEALAMRAAMRHVRTSRELALAHLYPDDEAELSSAD